MASQQQPMPGTEGMNERDQQELNSMVDSMQTRDRFALLPPRLLQPYV